MKRAFATITALLLGSAGAQNAAVLGGPSPYEQILTGARDVVLYAPALYDGRLVEGLRVAGNLEARVTVLSTERGCLLSNGWVYRLALQDASVYLMPDVLDPAVWLQVRTDAGWRAFDVRSGVPKEVPMSRLNTLNSWMRREIPRLSPIDTAQFTRMWAKANLNLHLY